MSKPFLVFAAFLALGAQSCPEREPAAGKPWEAKDWTSWSRSECDQVLSASPWAQSKTHPSTVGGPQDRNEYVVQLRSALPIRHAVARLKQIEKRYDKMNVKQRQAFDEDVAAELGSTFQDHIVVRVTHYSLNTATPDGGSVSMGNTAALILSDGRSVMPIRATYSTKHGEEIEAVFPRTVDGEPIIQTSDKELVVVTGYLRGSTMTATGRYVFTLEQLAYNGKLEY